jgi:hypothetical protein
VSENTNFFVIFHHLNFIYAIVFFLKRFFVILQADGEGLRLIEALCFACPLET